MVEDDSLQDFDFDFIDSTIKSSSDELVGSLTVCLDEMQAVTRELELIGEATDQASGV